MDFFKNPFRVFILLSAILILGYGIFEFTVRSGPPITGGSTYGEAIRSSLAEAKSVFDRKYETFSESSGQLQEEVFDLLLRGQNRMFIYNQFEQYNFWGVLLLKNREQHVWQGFDISESFKEQDAGPPHISVQRNNNAVYLYRQVTFTIEDDRYDLLSAIRLEQITNLPFSTGANFSLSDDPALEGMYPVTFSFSGPPPVPENGTEIPPHRLLSTTDSDSAGVVYASVENADEFRSVREKETVQQRGLFHLALFFCIYVICIMLAYRQKRAFFGILQFCLILTLWWACFQSGLIGYWIDIYLTFSPASNETMVHSLARYSLNALFLLLVFLNCFHFLRVHRKPVRSEFRFQTFILALLFGILNVFLLLFFIVFTHEVLTDSNIPLLDLELAPDPQSFLFYLASGLFFTGVSGIILSVGHFFYGLEQDKSAIISVTSIFSFITFFYLTDIYLEAQYFLSWVFFLSFILFLVLLFFTHTIHKYPVYFLEISGFRKMMAAVLLASCSIYVMIWKASNSKIDTELRARVVSFANERETNTGDILFSLLSDIEARLAPIITREDLTDHTSAVQNRFQQVVQAAIRPDWRNYSFNIQLRLPDNNLIDDYTTNLDAPAWSSYYNVNTMESRYRSEQLRLATNRPVTFGRPDNLLADRYISFDRGWIPIYGSSESDEIIVWVAGDVYLERPDYNKPMRAVLSAATADDWKQSFYLAEFTGNRLTRRAMQGVYNNQPEYNRLPAQEADIVEADSLAYITNMTSQGTFRELLVKQDDQRVIKASTPYRGISHHLFSYFRLHMVLVFFGLFCFSVLSMFGLKSFSLFGQSKKFQHRLLDGIILATIFFLTILIFATEFAIENQNEKNIERDLVTQLNSLGASLRGDADPVTGEFSLVRLSELTSPLNVDAIFYTGMEMTESTTPQLFQQLLMPPWMPYPAYDFLYNRERQHFIINAELGSEKLLIGYHALVDENTRPEYAIAIPTFLQSPVYTEQFLETTSYLFAIYLGIFAFFIIGSVFLSNQLTRPLKRIRQGLNKISRGDMQNEVPVTSRDEIGSLARAYNTMVRQLEEAQSELVRAERESAWKEMAQQVAHEIKNPLTPMKLNLQHLQRQLENNPENILELKPIVERTASNIIEQIESLNRIASDFSKFAHPVREPLEPVSLPALVKSVRELYKYDESTEIYLSLPDEDIVINAVKDELRRVLINLTKNGIEASGQDQKSTVSILVRKEKTAAVVEIRDTGSGIPAEDKDKIFVPNFSTKSSGTGLGLAITKKIIEAHHGTIWFESGQGAGTTFFISLPVAGTEKK